ncbi:MAG: hypothetical protein AAF990_02310 [Bacteroidota bacterium]
MLRFYCLLPILLLLIIFSGCGNAPTDGSTWIKEGYTGKQYRKLAVVCVNESKKVRKKFRKRIIRALKAQGVQAVSGKDIFPDGLTEADKDPEYMVNRLNAQNVDGLLAAYIVREKLMPKKKTKVKGQGVYWVGKFIYQRFVIDEEDDQEKVEGEDEEEIQESFVIECVLHDVSPDLTEKKETLVWREFTTIEKDSTTKAAAQFFADSLAIHLVHIDQVVKL